MRFILFDLNRIHKRDILGCALIMAIILTPSRHEFDSFSTWIYNLSNNTPFLLLALAIASVPSIRILKEDNDHGINYHAIMRESRFAYFTSKTVTGFISAYITSFLGLSIVIVRILLLLDKPLIGEIEGVAAYSFLLPQKPVVYLLLVLNHVSVFAGVVSVIGLQCSAFLRNNSLAVLFNVFFIRIQDIVATAIFGAYTKYSFCFSFYQTGIVTLAYQAVPQAVFIFYFGCLIILLCLTLFPSVWG